MSEIKLEKVPIKLLKKYQQNVIIYENSYLGGIIWHLQKMIIKKEL